MGCVAAWYVYVNGMLVMMVVDGYVAILYVYVCAVFALGMRQASRIWGYETLAVWPP